MNLESQFLTALCPEPIRLLGQKLEPYSVGHECLLRQHASTFLTGEDHGEIRLTADLFLGVFFCCQKWEEIHAALRRDDLGHIIVQWQRKFGIGRSRIGGFLSAVRFRKAQRLESRRSRFDLYGKATIFAEYIRDSKVIPDWEPTRRYHQKSTPGSPKLSVLITHLMTQQHCTLFEALNMPFSLAHWLWLAWGEGEGSVRVLRDEMNDVLAYMRQEGLEPMKFERN